MDVAAVTSGQRAAVADAFADGPTMVAEVVVVVSGVHGAYSPSRGRPKRLLHDSYMQTSEKL